MESHECIYCGGEVRPFGPYYLGDSLACERCVEELSALGEMRRNPSRGPMLTLAALAILEVALLIWWLF